MAKILTSNRIQVLRRRGQLIRWKDEARMHKAGESYRKFREDMKRVCAIGFEEKQILMALAGKKAIRYD